jgi:hypothetical protein
LIINKKEKLKYITISKGLPAYLDDRDELFGRLFLVTSKNINSSFNRAVFKLKVGS